MALLPTPDPDRVAADVAVLAQQPVLRKYTLPDPTDPTVKRGSHYRDIRCHEGTTHELLAMACRGFRNLTGRGEGEQVMNTGHAGATFLTACHLAIVGWHDGAHVVEQLFQRITAEHTKSIIPTLEYTDEPEGDLDLERFANNDDECYLASSEGHCAVTVQGQYIDLVVNPFASYSVPVDAVLQRGIYVAALAYMLERAGYRLRITLRMPNSGSGSYWIMTVHVKDYGHTLDLPRVIFWLGHPAAVRHMVWMAYRGNVRTDGVMPWETRVGLEPGAIEVPGLQFGTVSDMDKWLQDVLAANKIKIGG